MGCPGRRCSHCPLRCLTKGWTWHSVPWSVATLVFGHGLDSMTRRFISHRTDSVQEGTLPCSEPQLSGRLVCAQPSTRSIPADAVSLGSGVPTSRSCAIRPAARRRHPPQRGSPAGRGLAPRGSGSGGGGARGVVRPGSCG